MTRRTRQTVSTAIRFHPDLATQLRELSDQYDVSVNWLVNRAIRQWLIARTDSDPTAHIDRYPTIDEVSQP